MFQSTRPCGARLKNPNELMYKIMFQSTRPCGARLLNSVLVCIGRNVSIHAPVRGATKLIDKMKRSVFVFQSTRPCGARQRERYTHMQHNIVSIHAPVRGATFF